MRNKKTKSDYHKKRQLLTSYDFYKAKHKKLPVSEEEYQEWLSEARVKFAKEEIKNDKLKLASK